MHADFRKFEGAYVVWCAPVGCRKHNTWQLWEMWVAAEEGQFYFCEHGVVYFAVFAWGD